MTAARDRETSVWRVRDRYDDGEPAPSPWLEIVGKACLISLERRPPY